VRSSAARAPPLTTQHAPRAAPPAQPFALARRAWWRPRALRLPRRAWGPAAAATRLPRAARAARAVVSGRCAAAPRRAAPPRPRAGCACTHPAAATPAPTFSTPRSRPAPARPARIARAVEQQQPAAPPAASPAPPAGAASELVPDSDFAISKISFGSILTPLGVGLLVYGFGAYFMLLPGADVSSIMLIYGFPISVLGFALSYAQLAPVPCK
jgi:hypothetical protein